MKLKFTKERLDSLLEEIELLYKEGWLSLGEAIEEVKDAYKDEIDTLEEGPVWIKDCIGGTNEDNN